MAVARFIKRYQDDFSMPNPNTLLTIFIDQAREYDASHPREFYLRRKSLREHS
jgi:hypothetical protein